MKIINWYARRLPAYMANLSIEFTRIFFLLVMLRSSSFRQTKKIMLKNDFQTFKKKKIQYAMSNK